MELANISDLDEYKEHDLYLPDVILVKKTFPKLRKRQKKRYWKLKHFEDKTEAIQNGQGGAAPDDEDMGEEDDQPEQKGTKKEKKMSKKA